MSLSMPPLRPITIRFVSARRPTKAFKCQPTRAPVQCCCDVAERTVESQVPEHRGGLELEGRALEQ
jgi:hypothetical protein